MQVCHHANREELEGFVVKTVPGGATVNTDEWKAYGHLEEKGYPHPTVNHSAKPREWARDDDGDGVREVHTNTIEGLWTGLRNFLRPFRGVNKVYLQQYIAIFVWTHNYKEVTKDFLRIVFTGPRREASA
jgi:transposase-like protein